VSETLTKPKVPAEYRGLARLFHDEVKRVDVRLDRAVAAIAAPLRARLRRHPRLRDEQVAIATKLYARDVPAAFRLGEIEVTPDRDAFEIAELRVTATWINATAWDSDAHEPGVAIARYAMALDHGRLAMRWTPRAIVSMHAIGRWHERSGLRDHAMLLRDLSVLAAADDADEKVATPDGGFWLGAMQVMGDVHKVPVHARNVRTWVGD
jgi:hypothetical protein